MPTKPYRIALGALLFEGNTLSPVISELDYFENRYLVRGPEMMERLAATNTEIAGALELLRHYDVSVQPLIAANGGAGGRVSGEAYRQLKIEMLDRLRAALPVDGIYLALHGSFIAVGYDDVEADLLAEIRAIVGADLQISISCDLHAHVTPEMIGLCDILVGYQHYPHDDTYETGRRAAGLLIGTLDGRIRPTMRMRKAPMILPAQKQRTKGTGPMAEAFARARARESSGEVLAASYFCVQPWLDLPDVGFAAVVVTDDDAPTADRVALDMATWAWNRRHDFLVATIAPAEAIRRGRAANAGPVVLADPSDCVGGGAAGDSAVVLQALIDAGTDQSAVVQIVDPETVAQARQAGIGKRFKAAIGNKRDPAYGKPVEVEATVERLFDGRFTYAGGLMGGVTASMGPSVVLSVGKIKVLTTSEPAYEYADEQFKAAGIDAQDMKFVVVKNPMNYQQAYAGAPATYVLTTPGPTTPDLARIPWTRMSRPRFPMDDRFEPSFDSASSHSRSGP